MLLHFAARDTPRGQAAGLDTSPATSRPAANICSEVRAGQSRGPSRARTGHPGGPRGRCAAIVPHVPHWKQLQGGERFALSPPRGVKTRAPGRRAACTGPGQRWLLWGRGKEGKPRLPRAFPPPVAVVRPPQAAKAAPRFAGCSVQPHPPAAPGGSGLAEGPCPRGHPPAFIFPCKKKKKETEIPPSRTPQQLPRAAPRQHSRELHFAVSGPPPAPPLPGTSPRPPGPEGTRAPPTSAISSGLEAAAEPGEGLPLRGRLKTMSLCCT